MHLILLVARAALAAVFLVAGLAKLADRDGSRAAMRGFGAPERAVAPLGLALPVAELLIGAALVPAASAPWAALAALALLTVFVAAIARAMRRGEAPDCHCFGQLHSAPAGRSTLIRNGALAAIAALVAVAGLAGASPSPTAWLGDLSDAALVAIGAGLALALAFGLFGWFGLELLRQNGRLLERIDGLEAALRGGADPAPAAPLEAPDVEVVTLDGRPARVSELTEPGLPLLLVFSDPDCGPCRAFAPELDRWRRERADELTVAVVAHEDAAAGAYGVAGTPSAVLISPDGYVVGGPAAGAAGIRRLVDEDRPAAAPLAVHHVEGRAGGALGEPFPPLDLPGLDGPVRSADLRGEPTLVLLWNPGCGFCSRMLDDVRALEDDPGAPRLLLVSAGDEAANRAMGLRSPVALDGGFAVGQALGAQGTPSAVLVDGDGRIASPVAAGGPAVLALARAAVPQPA